jgi:PAS domain S-box-containing protein
MDNILSRMIKKWPAGFLIIACVGCILTFFVYTKTMHDYDTALQNYRLSSMSAEVDDSVFSQSAEVQTIRFFSRMGYVFIALIVVLSTCAWNWQRRNFNAIEVRVLKRTAELEQTVALMNLLKSVATATNEADSINEGFQAALYSVCSYTGWEVGHAYIYSEEKKKLINLDVWHVNEIDRYNEFKRVSEMKEFANHEGFIGRVYSEASPLLILDIEHSPIYMRKKSACEAGLKAAYGFPVFIGRKVVAVIEFYSSAAQTPDERLLSTMGNIGRQLGQTIERAQFQERSSLLETVIQSANDAIIITKADLSNPGPEIVYVNEAFTKVSGYSAEETIGKSPRFLQSEFTKRETLDAMKETLLAGEPFKNELLNVSKDGKNYWIDISIVPVKNAAGVVTNFAAIERDITAKKAEEMKEKNMWMQLTRANMKAEAATRDLQDSLAKAEAANKAKSDFLANMSHELRTPMNGVLGMAYLLADTKLDNEQREFVSTINGSAENLLMLLNDILDFSKIEAGALVLEDIAFNFADSLQKTSNLLRPQAEKNGIKLIVSTESDVPNYLWGDPGRIHQIIMNLVGNAIKFTQAGHVRIHTTLEKHDTGDRVYVAVEDTGMGIPAHKLGEIFEKFTQADASVTRKYGGTGLGLAITKQLVQLMGGEIGVESVEGRGSTFWFAIPCRPAEVKNLSVHAEERTIKCQATETLKPIEQAKVLLVDDYPVNRVFAEKLLRKFGFCQIDVAENGIHSIEKYRTSNYDMIFMDCQMPELDGYQATEKIRLLEEGMPLHTPIIAMTANAMMGDREKCLKAGMDDYLSKPLRAEHLKKVLQTWFILDENKSIIANQPVAEPVDVEDEEAPVDMEQLRLFTDGDPAEEKALAELFLEQAQEMIVILENSTGSDKNDAWKSAAHRFKGSSGNLGASKLYQLCKHAEIHFEVTEDKKREMLSAIKLETQRVEMFFFS